MLPGYADIHLNSSIVSGLRLRGMDVVTAQERGQDGKDDEVLLADAASENRLMLTNDQDYLRLDHQWSQAGRSHAGIVYWHQDKYPVGEAIRRILDYATHTAAADAANVVKYL